MWAACDPARAARKEAAPAGTFLRMRSNAVSSMWSRGDEASSRMPEGGARLRASGAPRPGGNGRPARKSGGTARPRTDSTPGKRMASSSDRRNARNALSAMAKSLRAAEPVRSRPSARTRVVQDACRAGRARKSPVPAEAPSRWASSMSGQTIFDSLTQPLSPREAQFPAFETPWPSRHSGHGEKKALPQGRASLSSALQLSRRVRPPLPRWSPRPGR